MRRLDESNRLGYKCDSYIDDIMNYTIFYINGYLRVSEYSKNTNNTEKFA